MSTKKVRYPSLGTRAELEHANTNLTPIILLYQKGEVVSRLVKGIPTVKAIVEYETEEEALSRLLKEMQTTHFKTQLSE